MATAAAAAAKNRAKPPASVGALNEALEDLQEALQAETDPGRKSKLRGVISTVKELGASGAGATAAADAEGPEPGEKP